MCAAILTGGELRSQVLQIYTHPEIATVKFHHIGSPLNPPIVRMHPDEGLLLEFDCLAEEPMELDYSIVHCTPTWVPSDLPRHEFATGFELTPMPTGRSSQGTSPLYTHHTLRLPNDDVAWRLAGAYMLRITNRYDPDQVVLQRCFWVLNPLLQPEVRAVQPTGPQRSSGQRIELELDLAPLGPSVDPVGDVYVCITQNHQRYNARTGLVPTFVAGSRVRYSAPDSLVFDGGTEYRNLVYRSGSYRSQQIAHMRRLGGETHIALAPDAPQLHAAYTEQSDIDGRFLPLRDDCRDPAVEGEYVWFYFTLAMPELPHTDVYLFLGEADAWSINPYNKLRYSAIDGAYETRILLKQGIYSYRYVHIDRSSLRVGHGLIDRDHYATQNSYQVYVYHHPRSSNHWQLVGFDEIKTR